MDPNQAYLEMIDFMIARDYESARDRAIALRDWFAKGGYHPVVYVHYKTIDKHRSGRPPLHSLTLKTGPLTQGE